MKKDGRPAKKNKTHLIGFRVDDDAWSEIESRALLAGKTTNDWCRDELLARLGEGVPLTANEELIHSEVIRYGRVLATFLHQIASTKKLSPETAAQLLETLEQDGKQISKQYFARLGKGAREGK